MEAFEVGGCVRDEILGVKSKDIDFSVVLEDSDMPAPGTTVTEPDPFVIMRNNLVKDGFKIFVETPEHFTIRAQFPASYEFKGFDPSSNRMVSEPRKGLTADFVLARIEGPYSDGRRPDWVKPGELLDDLRRRDFTMNAIAKDARGTLIDPFDGVQDINDRVIRAVGSAHDRLVEDALRAVRALRFSVTKGFRIDKELEFAMQTQSVLDALVNKISDERISDELSKMFKFDTVESLLALQRFPALTRAMFSGRVSLDSTMKQRGRGR